MATRIIMSLVRQAADKVPCNNNNGIFACVPTIPKPLVDGGDDY